MCNFFALVTGSHGYTNYSGLQLDAIHFDLSQEQEKRLTPQPW